MLSRLQSHSQPLYICLSHASIYRRNPPSHYPPLLPSFTHNHTLPPSLHPKRHPPFSQYHSPSIPNAHSHTPNLKYTRALSCTLALTHSFQPKTLLHPPTLHHSRPANYSPRPSPPGLSTTPFIPCPSNSTPSHPNPHCCTRLLAPTPNRLLSHSTAQSFPPSPATCAHVLNISMLASSSTCPHSIAHTHTHALARSHIYTRIARSRQPAPSPFFSLKSSLDRLSAIPYPAHHLTPLSLLLKPTLPHAHTCSQHAHTPAYSRPSSF